MSRELTCRNRRSFVTISEELGGKSGGTPRGNDPKVEFRKIRSLCAGHTRGDLENKRIGVLGVAKVDLGQGETKGGGAT